MAVAEGLRVLRGPSWQSGDADGGEGHLGTVVEVVGNGLVRVVWDSGQVCTCKTGADGKYELRAFDTAPVGVHHTGSVCAGCDEKDIHGMLWKCSQCKTLALCSVCYFMDKHDTTHAFERTDGENGTSEQVKKRSCSLKIRSMGIFPGAKVVRGRDWNWEDQDGGQGSVGDVLGFERVARDLVRVKWSNGQVNSYRLGCFGCVDLKCIEEVPGIFFYRDHLPVVDTTAQKDAAAVSSLKAPVPLPRPRSSLPSASADQSQSFGASAQPGVQVQIGDNVAIKVNEGQLRELQTKYGGTTAAMIGCIGQTGQVAAFNANGSVTVKFKHMSYRLNPLVLCKVPTIHVGDMVQIGADVEEAKVLNKRIGWKLEMDATCGRVGKVVKIDDDGDLMVAFGELTYMYAPACCIMSPGSAMDVLKKNRAKASRASQGSSSESDDSELHRKVMKMLAQLVVDQDRSGSTSSKDDIEMAQIFHAISNGDVNAVKAVCEADRSLLRRVYKGMTLLMVASHEGHQSIVTMLLDLGADVNAKGEKDNTALAAALEGKKESTALLLLKRGASPHVLNSKHRSPAHVAAYNNMAEVLRELIRLGCDVNVKDDFQDAPLHDAIERDNKEVIDVLVDTPSQKLSLQNRKGFDMLQLACLRGCVHAVEKILRRDQSGVNELMKGEFNALHISVTNDNVECARLLLAEGNASVNVTGSQGLTALHLSCNEAYPRSVELLLNYGADVNIPADDGNTPLHLALGTTSSNLKKNRTEAAEEAEYRKRVTIACMLLEKGAFINSKNNKGAEPLQCCRPEAIRKGLKRFVEQNPGCIKRKGQSSESRGGSVSDDVQETMGTLLQMINLPCGQCFEKSQITLRPCGHKALCRNCCLKVTECPYCHQHIEERLASRNSDGDDLSTERLQEVCKQM